MKTSTLEQIIWNGIVAAALIISFLVVGYACHQRGWNQGYHEAKCDQVVGRTTK